MSKTTMELEQQQQHHQQHISSLDNETTKEKSLSSKPSLSDPSFPLSSSSSDIYSLKLTDDNNNNNNNNNNSSEISNNNNNNNNSGISLSSNDIHIKENIKNEINSTNGIHKLEDNNNNNNNNISMDNNNINNNENNHLNDIKNNNNKENNNKDENEDENNINNKNNNKIMLIENNEDNNNNNNNNNSNNINILDLPVEIIIYIMEMLEVKELTKVSLVNSIFYNIVNDERIWRTICHRNFKCKQNTLSKLMLDASLQSSHFLFLRKKWIYHRISKEAVKIIKQSGRIFEGMKNHYKYVYFASKSFNCFRKTIYSASYSQTFGFAVTDQLIDDFGRSLIAAIEHGSSSDHLPPSFITLPNNNKNLNNNKNNNKNNEKNNDKNKKENKEEMMTYEYQHWEWDETLLESILFQHKIPLHLRLLLFAKVFWTLIKYLNNNIMINNNLPSHLLHLYNNNQHNNQFDDYLMYSHHLFNNNNNNENNNNDNNNNEEEEGEDDDKAPLKIKKEKRIKIPYYLHYTINYLLEISINRRDWNNTDELTIEIMLLLGAVPSKEALIRCFSASFDHSNHSYQKVISIFPKLIYSFDFLSEVDLDSIYSNLPSFNPKSDLHLNHLNDERDLSSSSSFQPSLFYSTPLVRFLFYF